MAMKYTYKVETLCASLTPYVSMSGQLVELDEETAAQFPGYLTRVDKAPAAPPAKKMVEEPPAKKDVTDGPAPRTAGKSKAVPRSH